MRTLRGLCIILMCLGLPGCWPRPTVLTTSNVTQPVLVGKVVHIGGSDTTLAGRTCVYPFKVPVENSSTLVNLGYWARSWTIRQGSNVCDEGFLPISGSTATGPTEILMVDTVEFSVDHYFLLFYVARGTYGTLNGGIYELPTHN
jgi:hypothetical protein